MIAYDRPISLSESPKRKLTLINILIILYHEIMILYDTMNVFIRAMVKIFSFGERWNFHFTPRCRLVNGEFHLSPHENIFTITLINIHYLFI